jgi:hypothetical protein
MWQLPRTLAAEKLSNWENAFTMFTIIQSITAQNSGKEANSKKLKNTGQKNENHSNPLLPPSPGRL